MRGGEKCQSKMTGISAKARANLHASGISDEYINLMQVGPHLTAGMLREDDYTIPYFDTKGQRTDFQRVRHMQDGFNAKYTQERGTSTHVYIPPNWSEIIEQAEYIVITEGEKKAASLAQHGIPCLGLGGVDSWRTNFIRIDTTKTAVKVNQLEKTLDLNLSSEDKQKLEEKVCPEFYDLMPTLSEKTVYMIYDTDTKRGLKGKVQNAMFELACFLSEHGVGRIRQVILPPRAGDNPKMGLDDYLVENGIDELRSLIENDRWSYPSRINIKFWIAHELDGRVSRSMYQFIVRAIIGDLDQLGQRYVDEHHAHQHYFFDSDTRILYDFSWLSSANELMNSAMGIFMQNRYGITSEDRQLINVLGNLYASTEGIERVRPRRIKHILDDTLYFQLSDMQMARVNEKGTKILDNGTDGVLFLPLKSDIQNAVDIKAFTSAYKKLKNEHRAHELRHQTPSNRWLPVLENTKLQPIGRMTLEETQKFLSCLYYLNPWLRGWRMMMLPLELTIAQPNSGKTMSYNLRKIIMTGTPRLNGIPASMRDFRSDVAHTSGMWVGDNISVSHMANLRQLSDELARLITEAVPTITTRRLYTTNEQAVIPVDVTFALTSTEMVFERPDLMQRSVVINLDVIPAGERDGNFFQKLIGGDGREQWLADHCLVFERFFESVKNLWDDNYLSKHRLVNFEQAVRLMATVLGYDGNLIDGMVDKLTEATDINIANSSEIAQILADFRAYWHDLYKSEKPFNVSDVIAWAIDENDWRNHPLARSTRVLGQAIGSNLDNLKNALGLVYVNKTSNVKNYKFTTLSGVV